MSLSGRQPTPPAAPTVRDALVRHHVVVTMVDESGVQGVVLTSDHTGLLMVGSPVSPLAYMRPGGSEWEPVDGAQHVPIHMIKFVQIPGGAS